MGRKEAVILPCPTSSPSATATAVSSEEMDSLEVFMWSHFEDRLLCYLMRVLRGRMTIQPLSFASLMQVGWPAAKMGVGRCGLS